MVYLHARSSGGCRLDLTLKVNGRCVEVWVFGAGTLLHIGELAMDHSKMRRKVIKKLDFENCEVTTVRMRKRYRKRLKARMISEYEDEVSPESQGNSQASCQQKLTDVHLPSSPGNSPILFRKGCGERRISETPSPVLMGKQKSVLRKKLTVEDKTQSEFEESTNTTSPVFKLKFSSEKMKKARLSEMTQVDKSKPSCEIVTDDDCSADEYVIEEFSQELPKESDEECKISNFSSESKGFSIINISEDQSRETLSTEDEPFTFKTPTKTEDNSETLQEYDSGKKRKRHKKGGLVEKLLNLRKQLASEKRIREHKKNIMKTEEIWRRNYHVVDAWKDGARLTLKCQQMEVSQDGALTNSPATDFTYVILNRDIGHCFKKIKKGISFRIAAPWQEVRLHSLNATVLLAVTFIELVDTPPSITIPKERLKKVSVTEYKEDEGLLFDTIFASESLS